MSKPKKNSKTSLVSVTQLPDSSYKTLPHFSKIMYTLPVPNYEPKEGEGIPRRHPLMVNEAELIHQYDKNIFTLYDVLQASVKAYPNKACLGTRVKSEDGTVGEYAWKTYTQVYEDIQSLSSGLAGLGLKTGDAVGLFSTNRYEWVVGEYACYARSLVTVPLYDTLGTQSILHICNQTELTTVLATADKGVTLLKIAAEIPSLKRIIVMGKASDELMKLSEDTGVEVCLFSDLIQKGMAEPIQIAAPKADTVSTICYTSGTTGLPKGAVFTHGAMVALLSAVDLLIKRNLVIDLNEKEVHLSYLPLAHIFERVVTCVLLKVGASIGFYQGDTLKILEDVAILRPTVFVSVPRLFNRIYDRVMAGVASKGALSQYIFSVAFESKKRALAQGNLTHWLWDRLVFGAVKARLGGRVRAMITGAAPIGPEVMQFLRVAFACEVYEGYGQTETCAASCLTQRGDYSVGHVGLPTPCNEVMLVDVPEMSYFSRRPGVPERGEICFRGPNCFSGYYKEPEKTAETIDSDGWVHTGDIGEWDAQGRLRIIDRKKNIFKLAQGEYIAPEKIENILALAPLLEQIFVYGNSLRASLVAIVVPDKDALLQKYKEKHSDLKAASFDELYASHYAELCALTLSNLTSFARQKPALKGFEIPKAIFLEKTPFSVQNALLTSTFKLKRFEATNYYKTTIDQLYSDLKE